MAFLRRIFGEFQWTPPPWLKRIGILRFLGVVAASIAVFWASLAIWEYYDSRPGPPRVVASAKAPGVTPIVDDELRPQPLYIDFDIRNDPRTPAWQVDSVARIDLVGEALTEGITMKPAAAGEWRWQNESRLQFLPDEDWPAGQTYTVEFDESVFASDLLFDSREVEFTTAKFDVRLSELMFYQDPVERAERRVVATLNFSHPVDREDLERRLSLSMRESDQTIADAPANVEYTIEYGELDRVAYVNSSRIEIPPNENYMTMTIEDGLSPVSGPGRTEKDIIDTVLIPDVGSYFRASAVQHVLARDDEDRPQQTLTFEFTDHVNAEALEERLSAYILPRSLTMEGNYYSNRYWSSPREVTREVLAQATRYELTLNPTERESAQFLSAAIDVPENSVLYIRIEQGLESDGGFIMSVPFDEIVRVGQYPREVNVAREGAILPLTGDHQLTFLSRGLDTLKVEIARIQDTDVNHLASQTYGDLQNPRFSNYNFNQDNISVRSERFIDLAAEHPREATYSSLDLSEFLPSGGYYLIDVQGWDRGRNRPAGGSDRRLVLVTDLGLLVKSNAYSTHDVFVHSISSGRPAAGATVQLLGRNGVPLFERTVSAEGHATFPSTNEFNRERQPTVWLVRYGRDAIFMPYDRGDRRLQYSRFDVGGRYLNARTDADNLMAQMFSDRGIYRPGDTANLAAIVKGYDWRPLNNIPLGLRVTDPRGQTVLDQPVRLPDSGFFDAQVETEAASPTGEYRAVLYLINNGSYRRAIGNATFSVEEFQPDRLRIRSVITGQKPAGWVQTGPMSVDVTLENLFGTPAEARRITGEVQLRPSNIRFSNYPDHVFTDPLRDPDAVLRTVTQPLTETATDTEGRAELPLGIEQYASGIYEVTVTTEGFEEGGGRSVRSIASVMMSPLNRLLGYRSLNDLNWIDRGSEASVNLIALDSDAEPAALDNATLRIEAERYVSTLVRRPNGTYAYESVKRTELVSEEPFAVPASGADLDLPTDEPGTFAAVVVGDDGLTYGRIEFTVAGARNLAGNLERDAELELNLNGTSFEPGGTIEMEITAPYTGTGLITIERDRVYAWQWFTTDTNTSVQTITLPDDLEGNAYVNVAFVRDLDSPEIYVSPLSIAVEPFAIDRDARTIDVDIDVPELVRPGDTLTIDYSASEESQIVVYAVDEGILQVANYEVPRPLDFFIPKMALQVGTMQMVDLILPEFEAFLRRAAPGGGEARALLGQNLNPFRRKAEPPVVFWSGIVDAGPDSRELSVDIPDYFNGRLRVMAIAVSASAVGRDVEGTTVRGPFVITPNLLTAAAPGDEFDVTVGISNNLEGSGVGAAIDLEALPSEHVEIVGDASVTLSIDEGREDRVRFRVRALDTFGNATLMFTASSGEESARRSATLSVRPSVAYVTSTLSGSTERDRFDLEIERRLHPQFAEQSMAASPSPLVLADGMLAYLQSFPHGCAEQMVSKVFPQIGFLATDDDEIDRSAIRSEFDVLIRRLRGRQYSDGGFLFWPSSRESAEFPSVYIMHFLTDSKEYSLPVPQAMMTSGLDYLRRVASRDVGTLYQARTRAYAIYILTRNGEVTTNPLTNLHERLDREYADQWRDDLTAVYMAASYELLRQSGLANGLIGEYEFGSGHEWASDFDTRLGRDAAYLYLLAKHFPNRLSRLDVEDIERFVEPIMDNRFNTLSAAYSVLALGAYTDAVTASGSPDMTILGLIGDASEVLASDTGTVRAAPSVLTEVLRLESDAQSPIFWMLSQTGFDATPPQDAKAEGLELFREYLDDNGNAVTSAKIGEELTVRLRVRSTDGYRTNVALVDLLPGGFEVLRESIRDTYGGWRVDYRDIREDRVVFYGTFPETITTITYRVKVTASGDFVTPAAFAGSMYDRTVEARTAPSRFEVEPAS